MIIDLTFAYIRCTCDYGKWKLWVIILSSKCILLKYDLWKICILPTVFLITLIEFFEPHIIPYNNRSIFSSRFNWSTLVLVLKLTEREQYIILNVFVAMTYTTFFPPAVWLRWPCACHNKNQILSNLKLFLFGRFRDLDRSRHVKTTWKKSSNLNLELNIGIYV